MVKDSAQPTARRTSTPVWAEVLRTKKACPGPLVRCENRQGCTSSDYVHPARHRVLLQMRTSQRRLGDGLRPDVELRGDAEDCVNELPLRYRIALGNPSDLTFADGMHRLVPFNRSASTLHGSESEARCSISE